MIKRLTMNNKMKHIFFGFLILLTGMAFYGCSNSSFESGPETSQTGTGYFVLKIDGAGADGETLRAQTIMPETPVVGDFASYKLQFLPGVNNSNDSLTVTRDSTNLSDPVELAAGNWDLVVSAYKSTSDAQPTAEGDLIGVIDIRDGGTVSGDVTLTLTDFVLTDGNGTFSWNISWPSGITISTTTDRVIIYTPLSGQPTPTNSSITNGTTGTSSLPVGYYSIVVSLTIPATTGSPSRTASLRETLHINRNMTSSFTHTFAEENFFGDLSTLTTLTASIRAYNGDWTDYCAGETLEAYVTPTEAGATYNYQWYNSGVPIAGETNSTYTLTGSDVGTNTISVTVTRDRFVGSIDSLSVSVEGEPDGTTGKPFRIYDEDDLKLFGRSGNPERPLWTLAAHYKLMNNITLTGHEWVPVGTGSGGSSFSGSFDGNGKTISGLNITTGRTYQGFIGYTSSSTVVKNLGIDISITISSGSYSSSCAGGIVGRNDGGTIQNCYVTGSISHTNSVSLYTGGMVGWNSGTVENCYSTANVTSIILNYSSAVGPYAGGIAGYNNGTVQNCYTHNATITARSDDSSNSSPSAHAGGIVGINYTSSIVKYCYTAKGSVSTYPKSTTYGNSGGITGTTGGSGNAGDTFNCVAMNTSITVSGTNASSTSGRICGTEGSTGYYSRNYARGSGMTRSPGGTIINQHDDYNGETFTVTDAGTQAWWDSTTWDGGPWDFTNVWDYPANSSSLPTLKNVGGTQAPTW